jgi:hypothetical protein
MALLIFSKDKGLSLPATEGFGQMVTNQGRFLYWDPHAENHTADRMWHEHSEEQLRIKISERLITKRGLDK